MDSNNISKKEEKDFKSLIKTLRNEKSLFVLEDMIEYIKSNIDNLLQNKIITYKNIDDLFFFLKLNIVKILIGNNFFSLFDFINEIYEFLPEKLL